MQSHVVSVFADSFGMNRDDLIRECITLDEKITALLLSYARDTTKKPPDTSADRNRFLELLEEMSFFVFSDILVLLKVHIALTRYAIARKDALAIKNEAYRRSGVTIRKMFMVDRVPLLTDRAQQSVWTEIRSAPAYKKNKTPSIHFNIKTAIRIASGDVSSRAASAIIRWFDPQSYLNSVDVADVASVFVEALNADERNRLRETTKKIATTMPSKIPEMYYQLFALLRAPSVPKMTSAIKAELERNERDNAPEVESVFQRLVPAHPELFASRFCSGPFDSVALSYTLTPLVQTTTIDSVKRWTQIALQQRSYMLYAMLFACAQIQARDGTWDGIEEYFAQKQPEFLKHDLMLVQPLLEARDHVMVLLAETQALRGTAVFVEITAAHLLASAVTNLRRLREQICISGIVYDVDANGDRADAIDLHSDDITRLIQYAERVVAHLHKQAYARHQL